MQARHSQRQTRPASASRKRTVNCIRAVSDAVPISGQRGAADALGAAASPKRARSLSRSASRGAALANWPQPSPLAPATQQPAAQQMPPPSPPAAGLQQRNFISGSFTDSHALASAEPGGLGCVAEDRECSLSAVEMEMAATLGSQPNGGSHSERLPPFAVGEGAGGGGLPAFRSDASFRGGMRISRSSSGLRGAVHGLSAPAASGPPGALPMSPPGSNYSSYLPPVGPNGQASGGLVSLGSGDGWKGPTTGLSNRSSVDWSPTSAGGCGAGGLTPRQQQLLLSAPYGSVGGDSDMSAATGYTQLSRRFGSMHVASSDSLSDMAFSRNSSHFTGSAHGLNHSGMHPNPGGIGFGGGNSHAANAPVDCAGHSADTEARVRAGQVFNAASFASMAPVALMHEPGMMHMPSGGGGDAAPRHGHTGSCSLLDELDLGALSVSHSDSSTSVAFFYR